MGQIHTFPSFAPARASRIAAALLSKHSAHEIAEAVELLIDVLDLIGPPDDDGGDLAAVADGLPGEPADAEPDCDGKGDQAWIEWHTMHGHQKKRGQNLLAGQEDDEDDDPAEEGGDEQDTGNGEDEGLSGAAQQYAADGPGCLVSDPDLAVDDERCDDDRDLLKPRRNFIRQARCDRMGPAHSKPYRLRP